MDLKNSFKKLLSSNIFKKWRSNHKEAYLCSCFILIGDDIVDKNLSKWQFDFWMKEKEKMTSFLMGKEISMQEDDESFKKKETKILELDIKKTRLNMEDAFEKIGKMDEAKKEKFSKKIVILQNIEGRTMWNISLITDTFNVLNIKIDAISGEVISKESTSLLSFKGN